MSHARTCIPSYQQIRNAIEHVLPGAGYRLRLPGGQPYNRIAYQRVNAVAWSLWGAGSYRLRAQKGEVAVLRLPQPDA